MSKNNKKTINERTHNSFELYKDPQQNPDEEFAADFDYKVRDMVTDKTKKQGNNKNNK